MELERFKVDDVFGELRSACACSDFDKAHNCIRWFLLYTDQAAALSALHYAIKTTQEDTRNTYRWSWWMDFLEQGRQASVQINNQHYFRILPPDAQLLCR